MQNFASFKPEYIIIPLIVIVGIVLVLTLFTGLASVQGSITFVLVIILLSFLTADLKKGSPKYNSLNAAYKYVVLIVLFSFLTLM
jgi:membrane protein YqaA with SNARE-associated domain